MSMSSGSAYKYKTFEETKDSIRQIIFGRLGIHAINFVLVIVTSLSEYLFWVEKTLVKKYFF